MKKKFIINKIKKKLFKDGYCIVENVLTKKQCNAFIENLEKLKDKILNSKNFFDENSHIGQFVLRDLPLRDPKNFLKIIDNKIVTNVIDLIFKEAFILDNCQASASLNVKDNYKTLVHIDSHLPCSIANNTTDIVVCYCLNNFNKENGATKIWPKSHLSGIRIQNDKNYSKKIKKNFEYVEAKKGSLIFFLGQTWHQIGKNINSKKRWGILCHYKRWWIKPATDWTKCGPKIFKLLNNKQKELFGFTSIPPKFNLKTQKKIIKTLRKPSKLNSNYFKSIQF